MYILVLSGQEPFSCHIEKIQAKKNSAPNFTGLKISCICYKNGRDYLKFRHYSKYWDEPAHVLCGEL